MLYDFIAETAVMIPPQNTENLFLPIQYINEHFSQPDFSIEQVYKKFNISQVYFNKVFKAKMNITPRTYVNKLKTDKAKLLLLNRIYTNEEIAQLCGSTDVKYFYSVFKKVTE